ncbi:hypothetical protein [Nannocystis pusilla]|uniref:hypothetical protein n=1 Tax=Nannocystis pusilla TaxID=889268 RepID=UPI003B773B69
MLELLASVTGHGLSLHAASAAAGSVALDPEDWWQSTARAARQAGLKAARFTVDTAEDCGGCARSSRRRAPESAIAG